MAVKWYAVRTKPWAEYRARRCLEAGGLEVFLPSVQTPQRRAGSRDKPLFPGYLFLHCDQEKQGRSYLRQVPQLVGPVAFAGVMPPVADDVIAELIQRIQSISNSGGLWTRFQPGDTVRVQLGSVERVAKVVAEAESPRAHVRVLIEFLGRLIPAEIPWRAVQPANAGQSAVNSGWRPPRRTRGRGRWIKGHGLRAAEVS